LPAINKFLPTSVIGSYATPGWLWTALEEIKAGPGYVIDTKHGPLQRGWFVSPLLALVNNAGWYSRSHRSHSRQEIAVTIRT